MHVEISQQQMNLLNIIIVKDMQYFLLDLF